MPKNKKSFFERLTGSSHIDESEEKNVEKLESSWSEEASEEAQLTIDVFETPDNIIIRSMVAGVKPDDLDVNITHDMVTIRGERRKDETIEKENYFYQELYWGKFSRSILLPKEVDPDKVEATIKDGILTVKIPKINKEKVQKIKVKRE
ncbi:MAG: Hsp20/alpha crystallin family protein [Patescibacteria group bacterium]